MAMERSRYNTILAWGLLLFGFTLPLSKSAGNVLLFLIYPIAVAGVLYYEDFKKAVVSSVKQPLLPAFSLYFFIALIGVIFTESYADGFHVANKFFSLPAIYIMASVLLEAVPDKEQRYRNAENILMAFLIGLMILNVIAFMTYLGIVGHKKYFLPLAPMSVHHIWFSNINALGLYTAASFLLFSQRGKLKGARSFLIVSMVLGVFCILLSLARTAWFGVAITSVVMGFLVSRKKGVFYAMAAFAVLACIGVYSFIPIVHDRIGMIAKDIAQFSAGNPETSLGYRFMMWKAAIMMFLSNPLTGVGTGGFVSTMEAYVKTGQFPESLLAFNQPHNMYLFALATNGIPGLAALLFLYYESLKFALPGLKAGGERERLFAFLAAAATVHFMIAGLTDSFFNIQILRYTFVFIMGVCVRTSSVQRSPLKGP